MRNSIVNIESVSNNSFGTGFVIDSDEKGVYVLTCQHVLDDVETPVVENVLAKVIAKGTFIDMAVLYVSKLHLKALPLQTQECDHLDVEVIGFSHFNQNLTQKKHINATLYQECIELHSKEDDCYYNVRKIKANDGFNFDRGNSGSPVICKSSGNVIAMISNKEGNDIGYAIDIVNLKEIWKDAPNNLFETYKAAIEQVSGTKTENPKKEKNIAVSTQENGSSKVKYLIALAVILGVGFGAYSSLAPKKPTKQEQLANENRAKQIEFKRQQLLKEERKAKAKREAKLKEVARLQEIKKRNAQAKTIAREKELAKREAAAIAKEKALKHAQEQKEREARNQEAKKQKELEKQKELQQKKEVLTKTLQYEKEGFQSILNKEYNAALRAFKSADSLTPNYHHIRKIGKLLSKYRTSMYKTTTKRKVLLEILNNYTKYAPSGFATSLRKQIKMPNHDLHLPTDYKNPKIIDLTKIKKAPQQLDLTKVKVKEPVKIDFTKINLGTPIKK